MIPAGDQPLVLLYAAELDHTYIGLEVLLTHPDEQPIYGVLTHVAHVPSEEAMRATARVLELLGVENADAYVRAQIAEQRRTILTVSGVHVVTHVDQPVVTTAPSCAIEPAPPLL